MWPMKADDCRWDTIGEEPGYVSHMAKEIAEVRMRRMLMLMMAAEIASNSCCLRAAVGMIQSRTAMRRSTENPSNMLMSEEGLGRWNQLELGINSKCVKRLLGEALAEMID